MRAKAIFLLLAALAFAAGPLLVPGFSGFDPRLYPDPQVNPPVQPAGWAFSIWGVIYLWLVFHAGYGLIIRAEQPLWDAMRWPLIASLAIGAVWLWVAERSPLGATLLIFAMLALAVAALFRAPRAERLLARVPVGLYAGWLSAASFASLGLLLGGYDIWLSDRGWAFVCVAGAVLLAALVQARLRRGPEYAGAAIWALIGIAANNWGEETGVSAAALAGALVLAVVAVRAARSGVRRRRGTGDAAAG